MYGIQSLRAKTTGRIYPWDNYIFSWMARYGLILTRLALGVVFLWFGALKLLPNVLPIDLLAEKTIEIITFHLFSPIACLHTLAIFECVIGVGFLTNRFPRLTLLLILMQLPGTFLPLILFPRETWVHFPYLPTFEGQYIFKNFVLIAAAVVVGASARGGKLIAHPGVAAKAERVETLVEQRAIEEGRAH